jgi:alpha-beta hydrolase superfamily lysophospholipase
MTSLQEHTPVRAWDGPDGIAPRGTLVVIPGRGENPDVYERFGRRLGFDGYRVRAVTDPTLDADATREQIRALQADPDLPGPWVLVGSDSGALFAAGLAAGRSVTVDALVLAGLPTVGATPSREWSDELLARTSCPTHRGKLDANTGLRHGALFDDVPPDWFTAADLSAVAVPVLALHGEADEISPLPAALAAYDAAQTVQVVTIADGRHDALNDSTHRTAAATVVLFLERLRLGTDLPAIATDRTGAAR